MAYIKYCDYINGHDDTGDGSAGNPYKTITKASTGLTGGDEVRVAKSPAPIDLAGTLSFTQNDTAVVSTSAIFVNAVSGGETDGSVRRGDFIKGGDGNWWEVITVTDSTHATLYKKYSGATQSGVSSQKLGITSTGAAASYTTQVQVVSASGSSSASKLKISGGWDLSGPTQNGQTYFRQMHGTFANRYGYGLYLSSKSYVEIERCHFLRYYYGIYLNSSPNNTITTPTCNSNSGGIYLYNSPNNTITTPTCNSNSKGIYLYYSSNNTITTPTCNNNTNGIYLLSSPNNTITTPTCNSNIEGIYLELSPNNTITTPTCNSNGYGIYLSSSSNNNITTPTCNNNTNGIYLELSSNNIANKYSGTGNSSGDVYVVPAKQYGDYPCLKCQHFKTAGVNKCFYEYGTTERDTANARSGECLKYTPTSAVYYISQSFFFKADSGVSQTLSAYIKDDASFNGDVQAAIYFMGEKITGWTEWTPTTSYAQKSIVASSGSITEDGILELRIKCRGSSGNVFIDDISAS